MNLAMSYFDRQYNQITTLMRRVLELLRAPHTMPDEEARKEAIRLEAAKSLLNLVSPITGKRLADWTADELQYELSDYQFAVGLEI